MSLEKLKNSTFVKMVVEVPYRIKMYRLAKKNAEESQEALSNEDYERIRELKDIHKGQRCFIVATGPSLTAADLNLIKDEITFTMNSGYKAASNTEWHPTYYASVDDKPDNIEMLNEVLEDYNNYKGVFTSSMIPIYDSRLIKLPIDVSSIFRMNSILHFINKERFTIGPFSLDISQIVYTGKTVLTFAIQIAVYMGFDEIYILGADLDYTGTSSHSYLTPEDEVENINRVIQSKNMLVQVNEFAKNALATGAKIYNCTRGGKMECFERKRLEEVISEKQYSIYK